jgi:Skp family chaperone for outer membrane proteins
MASELVATEAQLPTSIAIPAFDLGVMVRAAAVAEGVVGIVIDTTELYEDAAEELKGIKRLTDELEKARVDLKAPSLEAGRRIDAFFKPTQTKLAAAEKTVKAAMIAFGNAQKRIADAARAKAEAEARERAQAIQAEADRIRATGNTALAEAVKQTATAVATVAPVVAEIPKVAGLKDTKRWTVQVTDKAELLRHALEHGLLHFFEVDESALRKYAIATEGSALPGVAFKQESGLASGK